MAAPQPCPLTPAEQRAILAVVRYGSNVKAAHHLGINIRSLAGSLTRARTRVGAQSTPQLAAIAYRWLGDQYVIEAAR